VGLRRASPEAFAKNVTKILVLVSVAAGLHIKRMLDDIADSVKNAETVH
jgi:hypothetical protein